MKLYFFILSLIICNISNAQKITLKQLESFIRADISKLESFTDKQGWQFLGKEKEQPEDFIDSIFAEMFDSYNWAYDYDGITEGAIAFLTCKQDVDSSVIYQLYYQMPKKIYQSILSELTSNGYILEKTDMGDTIVKTYHSKKFTVLMKKKTNEDGIEIFALTITKRYGGDKK